MATIQLDIAHDCTLGEFLETIEKYQLEFKIIEVYGPAGGNPLIEFTGSDESIYLFIQEINS